VPHTNDFLLAGYSKLTRCVSREKPRGDRHDIDELSLSLNAAISCATDMRGPGDCDWITGGSDAGSGFPTPPDTAR
jgi:hypothetical protein